MEDLIRILVVDDSELMRRALRMLLESDPRIRVIGEASNGKEALEQAQKLRPDVITMDVRMPVMDGLETTEHVMAYQPTPILAVTASLQNPDVNSAFRMLAAGALDVMEKPELHDDEAMAAYRTSLIRRIKLLAGMRVITHLRGKRANRPPGSAAPADQPPAAPGRRVRPEQPHPPGSRRKQSGESAGNLAGNTTGNAAPPPHPAQPANSAPFPLVVIGASAGGPRIVYHILKQLPATLPAAVVLAQHIADGFSAGMADWLDTTSALPVRVGIAGAPLEMGTVYVAADSSDILVQPDFCLSLDSAPLREQRPRPSVDIAMQSGARAFGNQTIGLLLSGMGRDGASGLQAIRQAGGYTLAQNESSSPIYGMPRAAIELGVVDEVLTPDAMVLAVQAHIERLVAASALATQARTYDSGTNREQDRDRT